MLTIIVAVSHGDSALWFASTAVYVGLLNSENIEIAVLNTRRSDILYKGMLTYNTEDEIVTSLTQWT